MKKNIIKGISVIGLILTILPSFLVFSDIIDLANSKILMIIGTLLWFLSSPFWVNTKKSDFKK